MNSKCLGATGLVVAAIAALTLPAGAGVIGTFDGSGIGSTYPTFASLAAGYQAFIGTPDDTITFSELNIGDLLGNQYLASKGVDFLNTGGALGAVMPEGSTAVGGYYTEPIDGYDGTYEPDGDKVYCRYPSDDPNAPFTIIMFTSLVKTVGSFIGMGGPQGDVTTLTVNGYDASSNLLCTLSVQTALWADGSNREGFWGIQSDAFDIAKVTITSDSHVNYANAILIDNIGFTYTPEPATLSLLALGGLAMLRRRRK